MDALGELWTESARVGFESLLPAGHRVPSFEPKRFRELLAADTVRTLVVELQRQLVAHTTFGLSRDAEVGPEVGEVRSLFVRPAWWRRGVGTALMQRALAELHEMGYAEATLWSFADNSRANSFYERLGFRRDGTERRERVWADILEVRYRRISGAASSSY